MKTSETPPLQQADWDMFLAEAKTSIDRRTTRSAAPSTRHRAVRRGLSVAAVSGLAMAAVLILGNRNTSDSDVARGPGVETTVVPSTPVKAPEFSTASQVLTAAAVSSASQTGEAFRAPYWRVESEWQQTNDRPDALPEESDSGTRIIWQGHTANSVLFQDGSLAKLPPASFSMQNASFSWDQLNELTTSPAELAAMLHAQASGLRKHPDGYVFKFIGELLAESPASPRLRTALWKVAADIEGTTLDGEVNDATGRTGWSITLDELTYVVDTRTGNILETRFTADQVSYTSTIISASPAETAPTALHEVQPAT